MATRPVGICGICRRTGDLADSHIIARAFTANLNDGGPAIEVGSNRNEFARRRPVGHYDQILCDDCEARTKTLDDYAIRLFVQGPTNGLWRPIHASSDGRLIGFEIADIDYPKLKLFALSVLLRAHLSTLDFFKLVSLGPHAEQICEMLLNTDPGAPDDYATTFWKLRGPNSKVVMNPVAARDGSGVRNYDVPLGDHVGFLIKTDSRPFPRDLGRIVLAPGRSLLIVGRDVHRSTPIALDTIRMAELDRQRFREEHRRRPKNKGDHE